MLKNKTINLGIIKRVANALGELNEKVAYVGGATVSIYADDPAADDVRPTKDVDITLEIASLDELEQLRKDLVKKGFRQSHEDNIICRFRYGEDDILVDVMATQEIGWAPSDKWFAPGFEHLLPFKIDEDTKIQILPVTYFLATKFSAFHDRGRDPRTSKDFEDIVYILDNHLNIVNAIKTAPSALSRSNCR